MIEVCLRIMHVLYDSVCVCKQKRIKYTTFRKDFLDLDRAVTDR
jgi:hypothetical protein